MQVGVRDPGLIPGSGRSSGGGHGNPLQYSFLENPHGQKLVGYSPWGHKELDRTEVTQGEKPIEYKTLRVNPNINQGPWIIIMCQCWFISVANAPLLLIMGEVMPLWGQDIMGNLSTFQSILL